MARPVAIAITVEKNNFSRFRSFCLPVFSHVFGCSQSQSHASKDSEESCSILNDAKLPKLHYP